MAAEAPSAAITFAAQSVVVYVVRYITRWTRDKPVLCSELVMVPEYISLYDAIKPPDRPNTV